MEQQPATRMRLEDRTDVDYEFGIVDLVLGILTLPLLFWALMYAVTGHEHLYASRRSRLRLYALLLVLEAIGVAAIVAWVVLT